jgi:hypothetical protein
MDLDSETNRPIGVQKGSCRPLPLHPCWNGSEHWYAANVLMLGYTGAKRMLDSTQTMLDSEMQRRHSAGVLELRYRDHHSMKGNYGLFVRIVQLA